MTICHELSRSCAKALNRLKKLGATTTADKYDGHSRKISDVGIYVNTGKLKRIVFRAI